MHPFISSISVKEMQFISGLDYGNDASRHEQALRELIFDRSGKFEEGEYWFPYEVVELGSNALQVGHEREFTICTLLVIEAVISGFDQSTDLMRKSAEMTPAYSSLPTNLNEIIVEAYLKATKVN